MPDHASTSRSVTRSATLTLPRRAVLGGGIAAAAAMVAGCSTKESDAPVPVSDRVPLPTHVPYTDVTPDLVGEHGSADAFINYPATPAISVPEVPGDGEPVSAMCATYMSARPPAPGNEGWQNLNDALGSEFRLDQVPAGDYVTKFSTVMAGGDLPDVVEIAKVTRLPQLVEATLIDLTEHLSGDAIKNYPNLANLPTECWQAGVHNNAIYGIPTHRGMWQSPILMARKELTEAKGIDLEQITNFDDFLNVCVELTDQGDSVHALTTMPTDYLASMLGLPRGWRLEDGGLVSAYEVPEHEELLNAGVKLWEAGVVRPDAFTLSGFQPEQSVHAGQSVMFSGSYPTWIQYAREYTGTEPFTVTGLPLPGFNGGEGTFRLGDPAFSVAGISKRNEDRVEAVLKVLDYLCAPFGSAEHLTVQYGKQGVDYTLDGTDMVQTPDGVQNVLSLVSLVCPPRVGYYPNDPSVIQEWHAHMKRMATINPTQNPALYRYSATEVSKGPGLNRKISSTVNDILQGRKPVSDWPEAVSAWRSGGGDQIRGELEEALAAEA